MRQIVSPGSTCGNRIGMLAFRDDGLDQFFHARGLHVDAQTCGTDGDTFHQ